MPSLYFSMEHKELEWKLIKSGFQFYTLICDPILCSKEFMIRFIGSKSQNHLRLHKKWFKNEFPNWMKSPNMTLEVESVSGYMKSRKSAGFGTQLFQSWSEQDYLYCSSCDSVLWNKPMSLQDHVTMNQGRLILVRNIWSVT